MKVRYCDYNYRFLMHAINQPVRETGQQATTYPSLNFWARHRECNYTPNRPVYLIEKLLPQTRRFSIVPGDRVV